MKVYDNAGHELTLNEPALGGGAEGEVYAIKGYSKVAKIYFDNAESNPESHREKIEAMVSAYPSISKVPELKNVAWPMAALYADKSCTKFVGFGMKEVKGGDHLSKVYAYNPGLSSGYSINDRIGFLIELAEAVSALHRFGHIVGDFNDNNIPVLPGGHAALVDVDSFHIHLNNRLFKCEVCLSGYVAPELIRNVRGTTYAKCKKRTFTKETDRFSLAIHVFRNLFNGLHPYHCVVQPDKNGSTPAPIPQDVHVERGETPFFVKVAKVKLPDYAPSVDAFPKYLTDLFRRAFVEGGSNPEKRPTADEWAANLKRYRADIVTSCGNQSHAHWKGANGCPYCAADARLNSACGKVLGGGRPTVAAATSALVASTKIAAQPNTALRAVNPTSLTSNQITKQKYQIMTMSGAAALSFVGSAFMNSLLFIGFLGWILPVFLLAPVYVGGLVATWYFNMNFAKDESGPTIAKAIAFSLLGNVAVAVAYPVLFYSFFILTICLIIGALAGI